MKSIGVAVQGEKNLVRVYDTDGRLLFCQSGELVSHTNSTVTIARLGDDTLANVYDSDGRLITSVQYTTVSALKAKKAAREKSSFWTGGSESSSSSSGSSSDFVLAIGCFLGAFITLLFSMCTKN